MSKIHRLDIVGVSLIFASFIFLGAALFVPQRSHAQSLEELQSQFNALMEQVKSVHTQMAQLQGNNGATTTPRMNRSERGEKPPICSPIARLLRRGSSGDDVSTLQKFLSEHGNLPADAVTGFFGPSTEQALKEWQSKEGIVSRGNASTTGWGMVGAKTREAIKEKCGNFGDNKKPEMNWGMSSGTPREWRPERASSTMPMPNSDDGMRPKPPMQGTQPASGTPPLMRMPFSPASGTPPMPMQERRDRSSRDRRETSSIDAQTQANLAAALTALEEILRDVIEQYKE